MKKEYEQPFLTTILISNDVIITSDPEDTCSSGEDEVEALQ